jgi:hypothetical protein
MTHLKERQRRQETYMQGDEDTGQSTDETGLTVAAATGDERVDLALAKLAGLDELPLAAQVTVFDDVHRLLQDALTAAEPSVSETPAR